MRMRVLTHTNKGKLLAIADQITNLIQEDKPRDTIMPAYPCDGERLIVIVATAKKTMPDKLLFIAQIGFLLGLPLEGKVSRSDG